MLAVYQPLFDKACEKAMEKNIVLATDETEVEVPTLEMEVEGIKLEIFAATEDDIGEQRKVFEMAEHLLS